MVIGQSHMESGKCRSSKERMKRMRGHQRHTIKRCPLLRFEDKLEVLTPTRMNNEHTSQYSPLGVAPNFRSRQNLGQVFFLC